MRPPRQRRALGTMRGRTLASRSICRLQNIPQASTVRMFPSKMDFQQEGLAKRSLKESLLELKNLQMGGSRLVRVRSAKQSQASRPSPSPPYSHQMM